MNSDHLSAWSPSFAVYRIRFVGGPEDGLETVCPVDFVDRDSVVRFPSDRHGATYIYVRRAGWQENGEIVFDYDGWEN